MTHQLLGNGTLIIISHPMEWADHFGFIDCTNQTEVLDMTYYPGDNTYVTECKVNLPPGHTPADLIMPYGMLYLKKDAQCTIGTQAAAGGELLCYLGYAPESTKAFVWPNSQGSFY